jgi:preprotein translocase subunit YajC
LVPCRRRGPEEIILLSFISILAQSKGTSSSWGLFVPLLFMGFIFYFLLIRPQQRQRRNQRQLVQSLGVGDEVITMSGIYGTIREVDDESVTLEVSPGVEIKFMKGAVARKLVYNEDDYEDHDGADEREAGEQS